MYCPNCKQEYDGKFCPECGTRLIEKPANGFSVNFGDANAISGGVHLADSHNVHNEDRSVHNITNTTSTVNNITQVAAQKTEIEVLQEKKTLYLNECKRAYEDNVLEQAEVVALEECRIKLGLDKASADAILESVRVMSERNARKSELNPIARTKLKILTDNLQKNEVKALMQQIDTLEPLVNRYNHDELTRKFYLVLSALKSEKCIDLYENTKTDNYWNTFWSYLAYIKSGRISEAEDTLASLDRFTSYPEDNMTVLAVAGAIMMGDDVTAKELLNAVTGEYTPALQRFVDSIYLLLEPEMGKEMGADENTCAFYLVNFFGQKKTSVKEESERMRNVAESKNEVEYIRKDDSEKNRQMAKICPQNIDELQNLIIKRIETEGPECDLNDIDVCKITDMNSLFVSELYDNIFRNFNGDISQWDVSNVEDMSFMFIHAKSFNGDLSNWNVSKVKDMQFMFYGCESFEGKGLDNWDVSNVTDMEQMFYECDSLKTPPSWFKD